MKICTKCNIEKSFLRFSKRSDSKDGYRHICKDCFNITRKGKRKPITNNNYYLKNKEILKIKRKEKRIYRNEKDRIRRDTDKVFKLKLNIRCLIGISIKRCGYSKKTKTQNILGCTFEEFKMYLESKFEPWMSWENRGLYNGELNYGWDIDHIIPVSSAITEEELIRLNHYTNLQPLCSKVNREIKRNNIKEVPN